MQKMIRRKTFGQSLFTGIASAALSVAALVVVNSAAVSAKGASTENRDVAAFDAVVLKSSADVFVKVGPGQSVKVVADSDVIDRLRTDVRDGALVVSMKKGTYRNIKKLEVHVTVPSLHRADLKGSGDITVSDAKADVFSAKLNGSGDMEIDDGKIGSLSLSLKGSGDMEVSGTCEGVAVQLLGSGDIEADDMKCATADVELKGSGDISVYASKSARLTVQGSGDIRLKGHPESVTSQVRGSGDIYQD